jgi:hypothetical protein
VGIGQEGDSSAMSKIRLGLGFVIMLLGVTIIVRSALVVAEKGLALSALWQPILLGSLMIAYGINRWRSWRVKP